jgi:phosphatidate cytidylyltransferase
MLWQRLLTALVLIPLVVLAILYLENRVFAALLAAVILAGAYEMARLGNLEGPPAIGLFLLFVAGLMWLAWWALGPVPLQSLLWLIGIWWLLLTVVLVARRRELQRVDTRRPTVLLLGGLVLVSAWISIVRLHAASGAGPLMVLYLFLLIWVADSGAYFAGRAFGRAKLSPFVSPGKTWAGVAGAMVGAAFCAVIVWSSGQGQGVSLTGLLLLSLLVTAVSIGGDLGESRLKREAGVKDSGSLLPGHGGVLDRIDSLLAAAPVFALGASLLGVMQ